MKTKKGEEVIDCDIVLSAVGVVANIENIGLEDVGIATDKGKILVDEFYMSNIPGYYAIGDCVPGQALAHVASAEGITCVEKIAGQSPEAIDYGTTRPNSSSEKALRIAAQAAKDAGYVIK